MDIDNAFNWKPEIIGTPYENFKSTFPNLDYNKLVDEKRYTNDNSTHYTYNIDNQDLLYLMYGNNKEIFDNNHDNTQTKIKIKLNRLNNSWKISNMM